MRPEEAERLMREALRLAREASEHGDVPVGAVVTHAGRIVGRGANRSVRDVDPTAHAEVVALRAAATTLGTPRLNGCTLVVTLEPCAMCAGAIVLARLDALVFGAFDDKAGMCGSVLDLVRHPRLNHRVDVQPGVLRDECGMLLAEFFAPRRSKR